MFRHKPDFKSRLISVLRRSFGAVRKRPLAYILLALCLRVTYVCLFPPPCLICVPQDEDRTRVLIIGIDGLTVRSLGKGNTPTLDKLIKTGAYSLTAQANLPTLSSPNWASMLMGARPREHFIRSNDWRPADYDEKTFCGRPQGAGWPTLYHLMQAQRPKAHTVIVHDWVGIMRFVPRSQVDTRRFTLTPWYTQYIAKRQVALGPDLMFVHYDHVDGAGHKYGYDSWQYLRAVAKTDTYVSQLLDVLVQNNLREHTLVMVLADHGATRFNHGGLTPEERTIPWILSGPGVTPGEIKTPVHIHDTAATAAWVLGVTPPDCWSGQVIQDAFAQDGSTPLAMGRD